MEISVAIIEDEEAAIEALHSALLRYRKETGIIIKTYVFNIAEKFLIDYKPIYDVVFMDIELGHMNGLDASKELRIYDSNVHIIFVTNMAQFAIQGYKVNALDYFIKPISYYDLKMRMDRIVCLRNNGAKLIDIPLPSGEKFIASDSLLYVEIMNHNLTYHTIEGNFTVRGESLKKLEKQLADAGFARCSSSFLVNLKKCREVSEGTVKVGNERLFISRRMYKDFITKLSEVALVG